MSARPRHPIPGKSRGRPRGPNPFASKQSALKYVASRRSDAEAHWLATAAEDFVGTWFSERARFFNNPAVKRFRKALHRALVAAERLPPEVLTYGWYAEFGSAEPWLDDWKPERDYARRLARGDALVAMHDGEVSKNYVSLQDFVLALRCARDFLGLEPLSHAKPIYEVDPDLRPAAAVDRYRTPFAKWMLAKPAREDPPQFRDPARAHWPRGQCPYWVGYRGGWLRKPPTARELAALAVHVGLEQPTDDEDQRENRLRLWGKAVKASRQP